MKYNNILFFSLFKYILQIFYIPFILRKHISDKKSRNLQSSINIDKKNSKSDWGLPKAISWSDTEFISFSRQNIFVTKAKKYQLVLVFTSGRWQHEINIIFYSRKN